MRSYNVDIDYYYLILKAEDYDLEKDIAVILIGR